MDRLLPVVEAVDTLGDLSAAEITSIELDSRQVRSGALFCCLPGRAHDGHDFAGDALSAGAVGLLVERALPVAAPQIVVAPGTARSAMAALSRQFYGDPAASLLTVGVTGTNGKTTVTHLLASILEAHGLPCTVIGTLGGARTTPEAPALQALLAGARDSGQRAVAMEVSSHALSEHRVEGVRFALSVFTNLSHEHLDYHRTMEAYFAAKAELFTARYSELGVVNADDPWGRRLVDEARIPVLAFSVADATDVVSSSGATEFTWRGTRLHMQLRGTYHIANAVAAATAAAALDVPPATIAQGLAAAAPVPGRFEVVETAAPYTVVVDYAHTPDGLRTALASARTLAGANRVVCVFGCGGDRDRDKRPLMGAEAEAGAAQVVVTSDNPRSEDPLAIIEDVLAGIADRTKVVVEPDRGRAIALAVDGAQRGDVVLVAGKGHETAIERAGTFVPFDDATEAARAVAARMAAGERSG